MKYDINTSPIISIFILDSSFIHQCNKIEDKLYLMLFTCLSKYEGCRLFLTACTSRIKQNYLSDNDWKTFSEKIKSILKLNKYIIHYFKIEVIGIQEYTKIRRKCPIHLLRLIWKFTGINPNRDEAAIIRDEINEDVHLIIKAIVEALNKNQYVVIVTSDLKAKELIERLIERLKTHLPSICRKIEVYKPDP